jgi:hypothetical protein
LKSALEKHWRQIFLSKGEIAMKKIPLDSVALNKPEAEADAQLVAKVWLEKGAKAARDSLFMIAWLTNAVFWEMLVLTDRARFIVNGAP